MLTSGEKIFLLHILNKEKEEVTRDLNGGADEEQCNYELNLINKIINKL